MIDNGFIVSDKYFYIFIEVNIKVQKPFFCSFIFIFCHPINLLLTPHIHLASPLLGSSTCVVCLHTGVLLDYIKGPLFDEFYLLFDKYKLAVLQCPLWQLQAWSGCIQTPTESVFIYTLWHVDNLHITV